VTCYQCGQAASARCVRCSRPFCPSHGRIHCDRCRAPESAVPSTFLYRGAVLLAVLTLGVGVWHLVAWPQFPSPPIAAKELLAATPAQATHAGEAPALQETPTPTPEPAAPTPAPSEPRRYTVQPGNTLSAIAAQFGVSVDEIVAANNLPSAAALQIGQELVIPGG